eukprot:6569819-Lingulodinium_polyedra.AAC.1
MRPVEGLSELELHIHLDGRPRHLKTILYHKVPRSHSGVSQLSDGARPTWSLGSLDVNTVCLYAELIEEED